MVRCADFYEKWKKDPNWCEKAPYTAELVDHYLEMVVEIEAEGIDAIAIYKKFPENVAREILKIKDKTVRASVLKNVAGMIKRGEKPNKADILLWGDLPADVRRKNPTKVEKSTPDNEVKSEPEPEKIEQKVQTLADKIKEQKEVEEPTEVDADGFFNTTPAAVPPEDPAKARLKKMEALAVELLSMYSPTFQTEVAKIVQGHATPTSKYGVKDAFYDGIMALADKKVK